LNLFHFVDVVEVFFLVAYSCRGAAAAPLGMGDAGGVDNPRTRRRAG